MRYEKEVQKKKKMKLMDKKKEIEKLQIKKKEVIDGEEEKEKVWEGTETLKIRTEKEIMVNKVKNQKKRKKK